MTFDELQAIHKRIRAVIAAGDELVIDGIPHQNRKARAAFMALLQAMGMIEDLHRALTKERMGQVLAECDESTLH